MRLHARVDQTGFVLEPRERALIRAAIAGGEALATDVALHLLREGAKRIEWWQINHVTFDSESKNLVITLEDDRIQIEFSQPSLLPEAVRERVTATILTSTRFAAGGQASAVISLRRRPSRAGEEYFVQIEWRGFPSEAAEAEANRRARSLGESVGGALVFSSPLRLR